MKDLSNVSYFGAGPCEAYEDKHAYAPVSLYKSTIKNMEVPYVIPQESGSHAFTRQVIFSNSKKKLVIESQKDFSFNASYYNQNMLPLHHFELSEDKCIYLHIDYRMNGVGSMSCNHFDNIPFTYNLTEKKIKHSFVIKF